MSTLEQMTKIMNESELDLKKRFGEAKTEADH